MNVIGIMGFKGSGKDTAARALINAGFTRHAFADPVKDVLSVLFGWPREKLEGDTVESREWREIEDSWWAIKLNRPGFTPRSAMTTIGTDIIRAGFDSSTWVYCIENRIITGGSTNVVITDVRFANEAKMVWDFGGKLIHVKRGALPDFWKYSSVPEGAPAYHFAQHTMKTEFAHVHESEWAWNNITADVVIENDGSVGQLHEKIMAEAL